MSLTLGTRVSVRRQGSEMASGMVAFDNSDGTYDLILDDGSDLDAVPIADLEQLETHTIRDILLPRDDGLLEASPGHHKPDDALRFVCVSDTHGRHREIGDIPPGDVLIHAGDFTNTGEPEQVQDLVDWLSELPHRFKVVIAGNHDITFDEKYYLERGAARFHNEREALDPRSVRRILTESAHVVYLEDQELDVPLGDSYIKLWGSPYQPAFCDWAFNLERGELMRVKASEIPTETDVLVTHGPPLGHGDMTSCNGRVGCEHTLIEVEARVKPSVHIFGHIHSGYGLSTNQTTAFVNASTCTSEYEPTNPPIVFDLARKDGMLTPTFVRDDLGLR